MISWLSPSVFFLFISSVNIVPNLGSLPPEAEVSYSKSGDFIIGGLFSMHFSISDLCDYGLLKDAVHRSELMIFAIEQINNRTDILPNVTLGFAIRDYCGLESIVASVALSLAGIIGTDDGIPETPQHGQLLGIIGTGGSATSVATALVTTVYKIPTIGYSGSTIELSDHDRFPYFLRTSPPANLQARAIVDILIRFDWVYVGLIYSLDSYGIHGAQEIQNLAEENEICLAYAETIRESATENEVQEIVDKILRFKRASVIVFFCSSIGGARGILPALIRTAPSHPGITIISSDSFASSASLVEWGVAHLAEGSFLIKNYYKDVPGFQDYYRLANFGDTDPLNPWVNAVLSTCRQDNTCSKVTWGSHHVADAVYAFATALDEILQEDCEGDVDCLLNGTVTGENVISHLRDIKFEGVDGLFEFDANGDPVGKYRVMSTQQAMDSSYNGVELGVWDSRGTVGDRLDIQVDGLRWSYGAEKLPRSICRDECRPGYKIVPLEEKCCYGCQRCPQNAIVTNSTECVECDEFHWPTLNFTRCTMMIPSYIDLQNGITIIVLVLSSFGIILSSIAASGILYYRQHPLIKATSRELSCVNIMGLFVAFLSVFLILSYPSSVSCFISDASIALSLTLTYAPTFLKVNRIYRIFTSAKKSNRRPKYVGQRAQLSIVSILTLVQLLISIVSVIVAPTLPKLYQPSKFDNYLEIFCNFGNGFIASCVYNLLLILACCFYAFKTRKVPSNYNESKFIAVSVYSTLILCLAAVPVYTTAVAVIQKVATLCMALILNAYLTLVCVYLPKLYAVRFVDDLEISTGWRGATGATAATGDAAGPRAVSITQPRHSSRVHPFPLAASFPDTMESEVSGNL
ncbi:metabotropic glutamate receptor 1-like [Asterias amurensis]|uniref:metabotropic glutamate receptor 1-like n=1 Tax=Asterias amurensis TaxID=7602 RepID=UPI003AB14ABD